MSAIAGLLPNLRQCYDERPLHTAYAVFDLRTLYLTYWSRANRIHTSTNSQAKEPLLANESGALWS